MSIAHAAEPVCIGQGDPKNDFYIKDLENKIDRVRNIPKEIDDLKNENTKLDQQIAKAQNDLQAAEQNFTKAKSYQATTLQSLSDRNTQRYSDWLTRIEAAKKDKSALIDQQKTDATTTLNEKTDKEIAAEDLRHKTYINNVISSNDLAQAATYSAYKAKIAKHEKDYAALVKSKTKSIDTAVSERLTEQAALVNTLSTNYNLWRIDQLDILRTRRLDAFSPELKKELKLLEGEFYTEQAQRKKTLESAIAKIPAMPKAIRDKQTPVVASELDAEYSKLQTLSKDARSEYDRQFLAAAKASSAKIDAAKEVYAKKIATIKISQEQKVAEIEALAVAKKTKNTELVTEADKAARNKLSRDYAESVLQFKSNNQHTEGNVKSLYEKISSLKNKQLENLKRITTTLPEELKGLKFVAQWMKESPVFNTEASTCSGKCDKAAIKAPFQQSSKNIDQECIDKTLASKNLHNTQVLCENTNSPKKVMEKGPLCIDKKLSDYIGWSLNSAIDCMTGPYNTIDAQMTFIKIANESGFRPFYSYNGGHGLGQTIRISQNEMLGLEDNGARTTGRKFLANLMANSPNRQLCERYKDIFDYDKEHDIDKTPKEKRAEKIANYPEYQQRLFKPSGSDVCQFISLGEGIHRSIINGLGLYLYYKDGVKGLREYSADGPLNKVGITSSNKDYNRIKEYYALAMYGPRGPGGASSALLTAAALKKFADFKDSKGRRVQKNPNDLTFEEFKSVALEVFPYMKAIDKTQSDISKIANDGEALQCATKYY